MREVRENETLLYAKAVRIAALIAQIEMDASVMRWTEPNEIMIRKDETFVVLSPQRDEVMCLGYRFIVPANRAWLARTGPK